MPEPRQILVVEDDAADRLLLTHQLEKAQIKDHVVFKDNGCDALDFLLKTAVPPIAIFLDLHLPGLNGVNLLQKVREEPRLKDVPVIVMTGFNDPHDMKRCNELGITVYLSKPIEMAAFSKTLADLFQKKSKH